MLPFGWHDSHENVPLEDARAELNEMRPRFTAAGVGSAPTGIAASSTVGLAAFETSTTESVESTVLRTYAVSATPFLPERRATPCGIAPRRTAPSTFPSGSSVARPKISGWFAGVPGVPGATPSDPAPVT